MKVVKYNKKWIFDSTYQEHLQLKEVLPLSMHKMGWRYSTETTTWSTNKISVVRAFKQVLKELGIPAEFPELTQTRKATTSKTKRLTKVITKGSLLQVSKQLKATTDCQQIPFHTAGEIKTDIQSDNNNLLNEVVLISSDIDYRAVLPASPWETTRLIASFTCLQANKQRSVELVLWKPNITEMPSQDELTTIMQKQLKACFRVLQNENDLKQLEEKYYPDHIMYPVMKSKQSKQTQDLLDDLEDPDVINAFLNGNLD